MTAKKQWEDDQPRRLAAIEQQRQACRINANAAAAQRQAAAQATAQHFKVEQEGGYKRISFEDFQLDGKQLAATNLKLPFLEFI